MTNRHTILETIQKSFEQQLGSISDPQSLKNLRAKFLGRQGELTEALKLLPTLSIEEKKDFGGAANQLKQHLEKTLTDKERDLEGTRDEMLDRVDLTVPSATYLANGHGHPTQLVMADIYDIFLRLGFAIVDGPEVETDWYNFEVLNMPAHHPARDMQDTFYLETDGKQAPLLPRTHTSASQIRYLEDYEPPFKIIVPGKVYRNEDEDRTHGWSFYQVEGLVVGEGVSMADMKGTLLHAMKGLLGNDVRIRFRPSFFPYTEPSVEVDIWYREEWLEICGAGMVHPWVLARGGVDPERFHGFAFGFGPDRLAMPRFGLNDLRRLWRPQLLMSDQL